MFSCLGRIFLCLILSLTVLSTPAWGDLSDIPWEQLHAARFFKEAGLLSGRMLSMITLGDNAQTLIASQHDNKIRIHVFEYRPQFSSWNPPPVLLYQSPDLLIHPSLMLPGQQIEARVVFNEALQSIFLAYGVSRNEERCVNYTCLKYRKDAGYFEHHGYLLSPVVFNSADASENVVTTLIVGFDGEGKGKMNASSRTAFTSYTKAWDEKMQKETREIFSKNWHAVYSDLAQSKTFTYQLPVEESAQLKELRELYTKVAQTRLHSKEFDKWFVRLREFFKKNSYKELDTEKQLPYYSTWLIDYAFWLIKTNQYQEAESMLWEIIRRDDTNPTKYLLLADTQLGISRQNIEMDSDEQGYYIASAQDQYRKYCTMMLKQGKVIQANTASKIKSRLNIEELNFRNCLPHVWLINSVRQGNLPEVQSLIEQGLNANIQDYYKRSILQYAIENKNYVMTELLLKNGADPLYVLGKNNSERGIFYFAYMNLHWQAKKLPPDQSLDTRLADLLLAYGADVNAPSLNQSWVLMDAVGVKKSDARVIDYLLSKGADMQLRWTPTYINPLISSLTDDRLDIAQKLMEKGADVNYMTYSSLYKCGTPLIFFLNELDIYEKYNRVGSVKPEVIKTLKMLFAKGADPTLGGKYSGEKCSEKNGWEVVEKLARQIPSKELRCIVDQHRPSNQPVPNEEAPLC